MPGPLDSAVQEANTTLAKVGSFNEKMDFLCKTPVCPPHGQAPSLTAISLLVSAVEIRAPAEDEDRTCDDGQFPVAGR